MLEAGAPLHFVMDQVGHKDSKTALEIDAPVQKRVSRPQVKRAFEELLARSDVNQPSVLAEPSEKMSNRIAEKRDITLEAVHQNGPWSTEVVHGSKSNPRG
jgi:hypothetical protein